MSRVADVRFRRLTVVEPATELYEFTVTAALPVTVKVRVPVRATVSLYVPALTMTWPDAVIAPRAGLMVRNALTPKIAGCGPGVPKSASAMNWPGLSVFQVGEA